MDQKYEVKASEILRFQVNRTITNFYKNMLIVLEDVTRDHDEAMEKLHKSLPDEYKNYVTLADYLTEDKFNAWRAKILSGGNDVIRELEGQLKNFDINLKTK